MVDYDKEFTLAERVELFETNQLLGQPRPMHAPTAHLVSDLWLEIRRLNAALSMTREGASVDDAKRAQNCLT
ncbi:MAG: hypothetical protein AAGH60_15590 [Pseudomonadota bacterium]